MWSLSASSGHTLKVGSLELQVFQPRKHHPSRSSVHDAVFIIITLMSTEATSAEYAVSFTASSTICMTISIFLSPISFYFKDDYRQYDPADAARGPGCCDTCFGLLVHLSFLWLATCDCFAQDK